MVGPKHPFRNACVRENVERRLRSVIWDSAPPAATFQATHRYRQCLLALGHHSDEIALVHHPNAGPTDRIGIDAFESCVRVRLS